VNIRFLIALAAILFSALPSIAAWDERFWPASEKPTRISAGPNRAFQSDVVTSNIFRAVDERLWAATKTTGTGYNQYPYDARFPDKHLAEMKLQLRNAISSFLDQTSFPTPFDPTSVIVTTSSNSSLQLITWNESSLLAYCGLPADFFNVTPPRNLAAHPGITSPGINYANYGWDAMRRVITNLIYTYEGKGILINEVIQSASVGISGPNTYEDDQFTPPDGSCILSFDGFGPLDVSELNIAAYASGISYFQGAGRRKFYSPAENGPYQYDDRPHDVYMEKSESKNGSAGFQAAYVGPQTSPVAARSHSAYSFFSEAGTGPIACDFTPEPPPVRPGTPTTPRVIPWINGPTISGVQFTADNQGFIIGPRRGIDITCNIWSNLEDYDAGLDTESDFIAQGSCVNTFPNRLPVETSRTSGASLNSDRSFVHIIQWDFEYK
jgi:hypothetical protein